MPIKPCPYCGTLPASESQTRCNECNGLFEPLSRTATQLAMGPWFVRDEARPFMPGFNTQILVGQVKAGRITADTIVRGPTTNQFWQRADNVPGLSRLLGKCHACNNAVDATDPTCKNCQADLTLPDAIDTLGLSYVDADDRAAAQADIQAQRTSPAPPPKPTKKPKAAAKSPVMVDPDLMKPIDEEPTVAPDQATAEQVPASNGEYSMTPRPAVEMISEPAEDLWQSAAAAPPPRRRRSRSNGPDPLVIGMGVLLLLLVAVGVGVVITSGNRTNTDEDTNNPVVGSNDTPALPDRTPEQVKTMRDLVTPRFELIRDAGVPEQFTQRFAQVRTLIEQAQAYDESEQISQAYEQYRRARDLIGPLEQDIAGYELAQQNRQAINEMLERVKTLRTEAEEAQAPKWASAAWNNAEFVWKTIQPMIESGAYDEADKALGEAQAMYQMSIGRAETGKSAAEAREEMFAAMKNGVSEQTLKLSAASLYESFMKQRTEAERLLSEGQFEDAESSFAQATETLTRAQRMIEIARFAKFYASDAGFKAAGVLLGVASDAKIEPEKLVELTAAFESLALITNPASKLTAGEEPDYGKVTQALVNDARESITSAHGEDVQASYLIGFHLRIIDQTVATVSFNDNKQKRVHQSLAVIEEQAEAASWDMAKLRPAIESVRNENRKAKTGPAPSALRDAWKRVLKTLTERNTAIRVMDPAKFPGTPQDPELFPGLGS